MGVDLVLQDAKVVAEAGALDLGFVRRVDADEVASALRDDTARVTVIHGQNETGTLQPVAAITRSARARGVLSR